MALLEKFRRRSREERPEMVADVQRPQPEESPTGVMTADRVREAANTLRKYMSSKQVFDKRVIENERWYKMRHWEQLRRSNNSGDPEPASAWLLNCIMNKHADAMDNYPIPVILPREETDKSTAQILSSVLPAVLEYNEFEATYNDAWWYKLKSGASCYGVFWNPRKDSGLGDVDIRKIDLLNMAWEPGINNLENSRNVFLVNLVDNDLLISEYPVLEDKIHSSAVHLNEYIHDDQVDTSEKSSVIDWYYKVFDPAANRTLLHYCKFVGDTVLYASEDDPACKETGFYQHGMYPFVMDVLFPEEDSPVGFGYVDVCKDAQLYIDKLSQSILKNSVMASRPRFFVSSSGNINEEEYNDWEKDIVHYAGAGRPDDTIQQIRVTPLDDIYVSILNNKIDELKETAGNRDFNQGGTASGVTAASAIAALQEAGSKLSRDMIKNSYRAATGVYRRVIEVMRQYYDLPRYFRIAGENGAEQFVSFDNRSLGMQKQGTSFGIEMGSRLPIFDIKVSAQKNNPFSKVSQNELAKEMYGMGFFNPQLSDQALACLGMMDFEGKDEIIQTVQKNGTLYQQVQQLVQQMQQMAAIIDSQNGTTISQGMAEEAGTAPKAESTDSNAQYTGKTNETNILGQPRSNDVTSLSNNMKKRVANVGEPK